MSGMQGISTERLSSPLGHVTHRGFDDLVDKKSRRSKKSKLRKIRASITPLTDVSFDGFLTATCIFGSALTNPTTLTIWVDYM
jgi:hypothetical protein